MPQASGVHPSLQTVNMAARYLSNVTLLCVGACVLASQSPINIDSEKAVAAELSPLSYLHYDSPMSTYYLANTGHGCQITYSNLLYTPKVKGGPLNDNFALEQVHFHWGETDEAGSEHRIDNTPQSMEAHLVHYNKKYKSFEEASTKPDGLAVVAVFLEGLKHYKNHDFQKLVDLIPDVSAADSTKIKAYSDLLSWVVPSLEKNGYYTYHGSLTTAPYSENVIWIIYDNPMVIGLDQINAFRQIENHHGEKLNATDRELQDASGVDVKYVKFSE